MKRIVDISHVILSDYVDENKIGIDFTLGKGTDTLFLMEHCKEVYSFDIQQECLEYVNEIGIKNNVHLILDSHANFDTYIQNFDVGIFNFGYFPIGDVNITTMLDSSLKAVNKALKYLNKKGILLLVCYIGHDEGKKEGAAFKQLAKQMDGHYFRTFLFEMQNTHNAPFIIGIEKIRNFE